ncbi:prephenate/arogenate dehydrogenase family protein [Litorimonas sp. WD9-15]|uniref:prephenate/arogenate dehydrogenase family protein n=1 Tax=Litorimonas sp. WD9-15 TaxID=3418716 RepID=UPI003D03B3FD
MSFDTLLIVGGGLIGSSIARAARVKGQAKTIFIADTSEPACKAITKLGIADGVADGPADHFAAQADLVILCTPSARLSTTAMALMPSLKSGAILTDVGSVKGHLVKALTGRVREDVHFIPGHPIAGTENSGPESGFAELFEDRWCVLTPPAGTDNTATQKLTDFWEALGSDVEIMDPKRHDMVMATTSHLPHLIAYTLVGTAIDMETVTRKEVVKFSAGGFRDFTRIAASDPVMWRDVFLTNKQATLEVVDRFIEDLTALKRAIRWDDGDTLLDSFAKTRDIRRRILDADKD